MEKEKCRAGGEPLTTDTRLSWIHYTNFPDCSSEWAGVCAALSAERMKGRKKRNSGIDGRVMGTTADGNTRWVGGTSAATQGKSISAGCNEAGRAEGVKWQVGADTEPESVTPASRY